MSAQRSDNSQGDTGTRDITYDLVSVIYHALQGAETAALYIADAEQEKNQELAEFFTQAKNEYQARAAARNNCSRLTSARRRARARRAATRNQKGEGGRMKVEVKAIKLSFHPSSFRLHP